VNEHGAPTPVAWTRLRAPESLMAPADAGAMDAAVKGSPLYAEYAEVVDRESAREKLAARLVAGAAKAHAEAEAEKTAPPAPAPEKKKDDGGNVQDVVKSAAFKDFVRTAAREVVRGMFKSGRR